MELFVIFFIIYAVAAIAVFADNSDKVTYLTDRGVVIKREIDNSIPERERHFAYLKLDLCQKVIRVELSVFDLPVYELGMKRLESVVIESYFFDKSPVLLPSPDGKYTIVE